MNSNSRPATPPATLPSRLADERFRETGDPCEWVELYRPGGLHPIILGDTLKNGQYRVIRKLSYGSFSTVWLCVNRETPRYVAVKVMMAKNSTAAEIGMEMEISSRLSYAGSSHIIQLLDNFEEQGPNGKHACLVYEPMAGTVASMLEYLPEYKKLRNTMQIYSARYSRPLAKRILKHALLGLRTLHSQDVVHGDLQPGNLLFKAKDLENIDESELLQDPANIRPPLQRLDGKEDLWSPLYLVIGQSLHEYARLGTDAEIKISDFGAAFFKTNPPAKIVTPIALRAPETILRQPVDEKIDIWSFGCLVYELITGIQLFPVALLGDDSEEEADDDHLLEMHEILGNLPDKLMAAWPRSAEWFGPNGERLNPRANLAEENLAELDGDEGSDHPVDEDRKEADDAEEMDEFEAHLDDIEDSKIEDLNMEEDGELFVSKPLEDLFDENKPCDIGPGEARAITSLIRRILRYEPAERPSAAELLEEAWFKDC